jgi:hypothetical protein
MALSLFEKFLYYLCLPLVAIGSILSPLTNDTRIFYGVQYLAYTYFPFPHGISYVWEIKPIFSHIFNYCLVVFTCALVPFSNHFAQEIIIKTVAVALAIVASWIFAKNVLKIKYSFALCFISLFACLNLNILQMEWLAIILSMISCALFMEIKNYWHYIAGALLILVLLSKGTTGALIISSVCIMLIFQKRIDWIRGGIGFTVTGILFFIASQTIWPEMLQDIMSAPILSHIGEYSMVGQIGVTVIASLISMSIYIPIVGLGAVYGGIWIKNHIHGIEAKLLITSWIAPLCIVWAQSESFAYQYFLFALPAVVGLVLYERDTPKEKKGKLKLKRENIIATSIVILFGMWVIFYAPFFSYYGEQEQKMNKFFWNDSKIINEQFDLPNQTNILYMDTGSLPYYVGANTSCRYVAPLVLQRMNPNRTIVSTLPSYEEEYLCVMNYSGAYILADGPLGKADGWFGVDSNEKISIVNKVNTEYKNVHSGAWSIYERKNESEMINLT